jgi:acetyltransferase-like isoleucine patch superfamily enzyme
VKIIKKICVKIYNYWQLKRSGIRPISNMDVRGKIYIRNAGTIKIGGDICINNGEFPNPVGGSLHTIIDVAESGVLYIGNNVGMSNVEIVCQKHVSIGDNVLIGGGVKIFDSDFHPIHPNNRHSKDIQLVNKADIIIEDNVFIGAYAIILKGTHIGKNSIVGAGSVVTKDIPDGEIWAGNPAKFIRRVSEMKKNN